VRNEKTVIVIAHRLSTVQHSDQILVLDYGSIVERGAHEELLAAEGAYHRLFDLQIYR
jgi:ABC-type multidrug transport system fused ATPase/permease subunit